MASSSETQILPVSLEAQYSPAGLSAFSLSVPPYTGLFSAHS